MKITLNTHTIHAFDSDTFLAQLDDMNVETLSNSSITISAKADVSNSFVDAEYKIDYKFTPVPPDEAKYPESSGYNYISLIIKEAVNWYITYDFPAGSDVKIRVAVPNELSLFNTGDK